MLDPEQTCLHHPAYRYRPEKIEGERLKTLIDLHFLANDQVREDYCVDVVLKYLYEAKNPIILVDACAIRHRVLDEVHDLVEKTKLPVLVTPVGKGAVNETNWGRKSTGCARAC
jgi:pyruvate decarboxylase